MIRNENAPYGDELLIAVFAQLSPEERTFRVQSEAEVVEAFYKARESGQYDELFDNYTFHRDSFGVRSRQLSEGLETMQQSGLLGRMNPSLVKYSVSPAVTYRYRTFIKPRLEAKHPQVANKLRQLAAEVMRMITPQDQTEHVALRSS